MSPASFSNVLPMVGAFPSFVCSYVMARENIADLVQKPSLALPKQLLAASVAFLIFSSTFLAGPFPAPVGNWWAVGTDETCAAQGFFKKVGDVAGVSLLLSIVWFSKLIVCDRWTDQHMNRWVVTVNAAAWTLAVAVASLGLPFQFYNSMGFMCAVSPSPLGCRGEQCTRGRDAPLFLFATWGLTWILSAGIFYHYFAIFRHVRSIEARASKFTANQALSRYSQDSTLEPSMVEAQPGVDRSKSNQVASQAMLLATYLFLVITLETSLVISLFTVDHMNFALMGLDITVKALSSLQGFVYFLIYARSRFDMKTPEGKVIRGLVFGSAGLIRALCESIAQAFKCTEKAKSAFDISACTLDTKVAGGSFRSEVGEK